MNMLSNFTKTVQPHYNMPRYSTVFNITQQCHGSQDDSFAVSLSFVNNLIYIYMYS